MQKKRERERERVNGYVHTFKCVLNKLIDLTEPIVAMRIWNQALIRTADRYPFFEKLVNKGDMRIDFAVLKDIPVRNMIDLDVDKTYQLIEEIEEGRLMDGFEYLLDVLYEVAKVLLGTTVKLPLEIDEE